MEHLTVDDIIEFVSLTEFDSKSLTLSATVIGHIRKCGRCLEHVRAFQTIYDEFSRLNTSVSFREYAKNVVTDISKDVNQNKKAFEEFEESQEFDFFR